MFFYTPIPTELGAQDVPLPQDITDLLTVDTVNQAFQMLANAIAFNEQFMNAQVLRYSYTADATPDLTAALDGALLVRSMLIGGGGSGGAVNPVPGRGGGGGGGAGAIIDVWTPAVFFPPNPTITIGVGGVSGNGTPTSIINSYFNLTANGGGQGFDATTADGQFGGDGGSGYLATAGSGGSGGSGSGAGVAAPFSVARWAGAGGGGGGSSVAGGGNGSMSALGFLGGTAGTLNNPGDTGRGYGAGGGGQGRADGGGGGGGGGGIGSVIIAGGTSPSNSAPGDGKPGLVEIYIIRGFNG